jgi:hypothetical protein
MQTKMAIQVSEMDDIDISVSCFCEKTLLVKSFTIRKRTLKIVATNFMCKLLSRILVYDKSAGCFYSIYHST